MKKVFFLLFAVSVLLMSCGKDKNDPVAVSSITLNKTTLALTVGDSETLAGTLLPANATNKTIAWSSSNAGVATVDATGKVTAIGAGTSTIIANAEGKTANCTATISPVVIAVSSITLNKTTLAFAVGGSETLTGSILPADATNKTIVWSCSNTDVATVDATGKVTAISAGTTTITATADGKTATCTVTLVTISEKDWVLINGVKWATRNVDAPGTFAATPEASGMYYQWNRKQGWPATGSVTGWDASMPTGTFWETENDPSPVGFRPPTNAEIKSLFDAKYIVGNWLALTKSGVPGFIFFDKVSSKSLFLPASGYRRVDGSLGEVNVRSLYWCSQQLINTETRVNVIDVYKGGTDYTWGGQEKLWGFSVRPVVK